MTSACFDSELMQKFLTLPFSEEGVLHYPQLIFEKYKFSFYQSFCEEVCHLLICRNMLELHNSLMNTILDEVVFDLNVFRFVMEHWIFQELDTTLIVVMDNSRIHLLTK